VVAVASNPGVPSHWNADLSAVGRFPWTCTADFRAPGATGHVLCDEPDPPVEYW
jgi:hypothetical protein